MGQDESAMSLFYPQCMLTLPFQLSQAGHPGDTPEPAFFLSFFFPLSRGPGYLPKENKEVTR